MTKNVTMTKKTAQFQDRETGKMQDYTVFTVNVNGLDVKVKPADSTGRLVLENYFSK